MLCTYLRLAVYRPDGKPIAQLQQNENVTREFDIQLFQLRLSTSEVEKSNTSAKGCWESLTN